MVVRQDMKNTGRIYRPELDVLRFFAFLTVFLHHTLNIEPTGALMRHPKLAWFLPILRETLGLGLPLFFFLSSYLITSLIQVEKEKTGTLDLRKFYIRRVLRIWPLYFLFLGAVFCLGHWWHPAALEPARLIAMLLLSGNWFFILRGMGSDVTSPLWSISVEEQFYLIWPTVARVLSRRGLAIASIVIAALCLMLTWGLCKSGSSSLSLWLNSGVESICFASGALLALWVGIREKPKSLLRAAFAITVGLVLWFSAAAGSGITVRGKVPVPWRITLGYAAVSFGCAFILWGFLHLPRGFSWPPLAYLGRISYGLYVYHALVLVSTRSLFGPAISRLHLPGGLIFLQLVFTISMAALSYRFVEKPFLKLKNSFEMVHTREA